MSLFYSYNAGSLHVSGPQAHLQESSYSCSHNHWFSFCATLFACTWTEQYTNKIVTSVGFHSICWKDARYKKLKTVYYKNFTLSHARLLYIPLPFLWISRPSVLCNWCKWGIKRKLWKKSSLPERHACELLITKTINQINGTVVKKKN